MQLTIDFNQVEKINIWKRLISEMTTEQIQMRSLLVSMSEKQNLGDSNENKIFEQLLIEEYNKR